MKIVLIFAILITTLNLKAGGISGGGGGTVITDPAGADFVYRSLATARATLLGVLKYLQDSEQFADLYTGENNIIKKVQTHSLNILWDAPCLDFDGVPNDGSINSAPNTICLSAFTIGEKVTEMTAYPQLLALMAHEYSHLQGYDEVKADEFQKFVLQKTRSVSESDVFMLSSDFVHAAYRVTHLMGHAEMILKNNPASTYKLMQSAEVAEIFQFRYPLETLDNNELKAVIALSYRITNLREYACSQWDSSTDDKEMCGYEYSSVFKDADEITMEEYSLRHYGGFGEVADEMIPNLMKHPEKYLEEIKRVSEEMSRMKILISEQFNIGF